MLQIGSLPVSNPATWSPRRLHHLPLAPSRQTIRVWLSRRSKGCHRMPPGYPRRLSEAQQKKPGNATAYAALQLYLGRGKSSESLQIYAPRTLKVTLAGQVGVRICTRSCLK